MKKFVFKLKIGLVGCEQKTTVEFEDDVTEEELEEYWKEWIWNHIDGGWEEK
jgi:hypothetical protein